MNDDKEKPLNINAHRRQNTLKRKSSRLNKSQAKKKETKFINMSIIVFLIFIILIFLLGYLIYKKFNEIEEIKLSIIEKNKEIENNIKNKDNLKARIKDLNNVLNNKEQYVKDIINLYEHKKSEFDMKKKIYENINELYEKSKDESKISSSLDEAIKNLNERISNVNK